MSKFSYERMTTKDFLRLLSAPAAEAANPRDIKSHMAWPIGFPAIKWAIKHQQTRPTLTSSLINEYDTTPSSMPHPFTGTILFYKFNEVWQVEEQDEYRFIVGQMMLGRGTVKEVRFIKIMG